MLVQEALRSTVVSLEMKSGYEMSFSYYHNGTLGNMGHIKSNVYISFSITRLLALTYSSWFVAVKSNLLVCWNSDMQKMSLVTLFDLMCG